jgi:hypothetical protein
MFRPNLGLVAGVVMIAAVPFATRLILPLQPAGIAAEVAAPKEPQSAAAPPLASGHLSSGARSDNETPSETEERNRQIAIAKITRQIQDFLKEYATPEPDPSAKSSNPFGQYRMAIAVIPDPVHSHLALRFDRALGDIEYSMQDMGWVFDHAWMESERYEEKANDTTIQRGREDATPGLMFFRPALTGGNPFILFLVTDTVTRGIQPEQFRTAVAVWKSLRNQLADSGTLRILGPTFSGSIDSLNQLLRDACVEEPPLNANIAIASGTITSGDRLERLMSRSTANTAAKVCGANVKITVSSFAADGSYMRDGLVQFLRSQKIDTGHDVMELREGEGTFGAANALLVNPNSQTGGQQNPRVLYFPRGISRLRNAYQQNNIVGFSDPSNTPRTQLRLGPETDTSDDTAPVFAGQQYVVAQESEMSQIATVLSRCNTRVVLLSATDVLDEIFVARYLQEHAPDVTIIIEDADILFLRNSFETRLVDAYVATPWPLIFTGQCCSMERSGGTSLRVLPSQGDEGTYTAALSLFGTPVTCMANDLPYESGRYCSTLLRYQQPVDAAGKDTLLRPPLWLSAIGRGTFEPITFIDDASQSANRPKEDPKTNLPDLDRILQGTAFLKYNNLNKVGVIAPNAEPVNLQMDLAAAVIALLLFYHGVACFRARIDRHFAWVYALADKDHHTPRLVLQAVLPLLAVPALVLLYPPADAGTLVSGVIAFRWCLFLLLLAACFFSSSALMRLSMPGKVGKRVFWWSTAGCTIVLALLTWQFSDWVLSYCIAPPQSQPSTRGFFFLRNMHLLSGSSPALVLLLLLAACSYWLHSQFARFCFFGHRVPLLPADCEAMHCPSERSVEDITKLFRDRASVNWILLALSCVSVGFLLLVTHSLGQRSLTYSGFDSAVRFLSFLIESLIIYDIFVTVRGWHLLRMRCLLPLKFSPLRWGFTWIKGFSWRRVWTSIYEISPEAFFDYMMRMNNANDRHGSDLALEQSFELSRERYAQKRTFSNHSAWSADVANQIAEVAKNLARVAGEKLKKLEEEWKSDRGCVTGCEPVERGYHLEKVIDKELKGEERNKALDRMANEEFVALLYLGYIRMVLVQIRNRIFTATILFVLLLWALTSYPWMNHHALLICLSTLLVFLSVAILYIYSAMHRDDILSRTTETAPGKLDLEFYEKIIPAIGLPLITLIASQIPELSNFFFSWIEPNLMTH